MVPCDWPPKLLNDLQCMAVATVGPSQAAERPGLMPDVSAGKEVINSNNCHACTTLTSIHCCGDKKAVTSYLSGGGILGGSCI